MIILSGGQWSGALTNGSLVKYIICQADYLTMGKPPGIGVLNGFEYIRRYTHISANILVSSFGQLNNRTSVLLLTVIFVLFLENKERKMKMWIEETKSESLNLRSNTRDYMTGKKKEYPLLFPRIPLLPKSAASILVRMIEKKQSAPKQNTDITSRTD